MQKKIKEENELKLGQIKVKSIFINSIEIITKVV
jgi:hypothetical protein